MSPCKILGTILQMNQRGTPTNGPKNKKTNPRDDVDSVYVPRKEGGRWLKSIQDSIKTLIQGPEDYRKKWGEKLITTIRNNTCSNRTKTTRKQKIGRKTTAWTFQATNKWHLTLENLDMAEKGKT